MSHNKITSLVETVANMLVDNEKLSVPLLSSKLKRLANNSYDQTIISMANVISKLEDNNKLVISKGELKDLYRRFYTNGTKFSLHFKEEMGELNHLMAPKMASKQELPIVDTYKTVADPILSNALESAFDKSIPLKLYSQDLAKKAAYSVESNLDAWNLKASKLSVDSGNEHFIVVKAEYETPKGLTSILVPVEINKDKALAPEVFMGNAGPQEINYVNIKNYLTNNAGAKLNVLANDIVTVLTSAIKGNQEISSVNLALIRVNASREVATPFFADQILGQTPLAKSEKDIVLPKMGEFKTFAEKFDSAIGQANFRFGVNQVNLGREVIARILNNLGIKAAQINVAKADTTSITYAVSISGKTAFNVPVKIANNKVMPPEIIICNGSVLSFSSDSMRKLFANNEMDSRAAAVASPSYSLKPTELIVNVQSAMQEENYAKAEDALNVLAATGDALAYKTAFNIYMNGLNQQAKPQEEILKCAMALESKNSKHPICGHTGLPLHKVYQDKFGVCHPLHRKGQEEAGSSAYFMNSKIFG